MRARETWTPFDLQGKTSPPIAILGSLPKNDPISLTAQQSIRY